ncbi:MAG TPA: hypothetical protein VGO63_03420 [Candidatus Paceibacterota bacterium]|jgi:hypothetical protein|nr:hypothetical protein [Candidatus Paceibacterota bacterium]
MPHILLHITDPEKIYSEISKALLPHKEKEVASMVFIVEGSLENPRIAIRYPGRKLVKRNLTYPRANSSLWANLLDFEVIPFNQGEQGNSKIFTYANLLKDFELYKKDNNLFWQMLEELYNKNTITKEPPKLEGIDSRQFLEMLKWMWLQEDLNYKLSWQEVGSEIPYRLQNKTGGLTSKGAGRAKFFAALVLLKNNYFDYNTVRKIIP